MIAGKKIYMAGSGGMLGEAFRRIYGTKNSLRCTDKDVNDTWLSFLDFRDADAYARDVEAFRPDYLFHLGAHTSLEYCEENPDDAYATNTIAVETAVHIANRLNIPKSSAAVRYQLAASKRGHDWKRIFSRKYTTDKRCKAKSCIIVGCLHVSPRSTKTHMKR